METMFGWPVDISGDTIVIGAHSPYDHDGAAYVFVRPATGWVAGTETAKLTVSGNYEMGWSVAIRGDTIGPIATLTPTSIDFGTVYLHQLTWKVVTLLNTGNSPLTINKISLKLGANTDWADFPYLSTCPPWLATGKSCPIYIFYNADDLGADTATLSVSDNSPGSPQAVSLTGTTIKKTH